MMTDPTTALDMRVAGVPLSEIADCLGMTVADSARQLQAELDATAYGHLGETAVLHLLRCEALNAALDLAEARNPTPARQAHIDQHRSVVRAMHHGALDTANRAAITRADQGQS